MEFIQQQNFIVGSSSDIQALETKPEARILVVSDIHGNTPVFEAILKEFGSKSDALAFCGDGMPSICDVLQKARIDSEFAKKIPPVWAFVQGNGDWDSYAFSPEPEIGLIVPKQMTFKAGNVCFFMTHGHRFDVYYTTEPIEEAAAMHGANIAIYGHTHISNAKESKRGILLLNPGSCSMPRLNLPPTFAVISVKNKKIEYKFYIVRHALGAPKWNFTEFTPPANLSLF